MATRASADGRPNAGTRLAPVWNVVATMLAQAKIRKRSRGDCRWSSRAMGPMSAAFMNAAAVEGCDEQVAGHSPRALVAEEPLLAVEPSAVAGQRAGRSHDPVAGHQQRHRVRPDRRAHGPGRIRPAQAGRDGAVRSRATRRNRLDLAPHRPFEFGAEQIEGDGRGGEAGRLRSTGSATLACGRKPRPTRLPAGLRGATAPGASTTASRARPGRTRGRTSPTPMRPRASVRAGWGGRCSLTCQ